MLNKIRQANKAKRVRRQMKESEAPHQKVRKIDLFMPSFI
jgi:hypothetical protein